MKLQHDISIVHTTHPFVIARGGATEHRLIRVRVTDNDGIEGWARQRRTDSTGRPRTPHWARWLD